MSIITFFLGHILGVLAGIAVYHWWITPDLKVLRTRVKSLEEERLLLTKQIVRNFKVTTRKIER